jgi:hypothetical protein
MRPVLAVLAFAVGLAACDTAPRRTLSPDFGAAVRHNMAVHIINPPVEDDRPAEGDGRRAGDAVERYRSGKVIPPASLSTSDSLIKPAPTH